MKAIQRIALFTAFISLIAFQSCSDDCTETIQYMSYEPIIANVDSLRGTFEIMEAQPLERPGKIYFYNGYLFITELDKGVHVIDNREPTNPTAVKFIKVLGNRDMAVKGNRLYLDNYIDLLTINIADPSAPILTSRTEEVFKNIFHYWDDGLVIDYKEELVTQVVDCSEAIDPWIDCPGCEFLANDASFGAVPTAAVGVPSAGTGVGGSFARFTITGDHLYTVDDYDISTFDISDLDQPSYEGVTHIGWGIETIFPYQNNLFIGSNAGMFIYDLNNPAAPNLRSEFQHANACDPVFVYRDTAYITLRDGTECTGFINQLDIVDVRDIDNPELIVSHEMTHPHGLSVNEEAIYICEGEHGINVFDRSDIDASVQLAILSSLPNLHAYDIIALSNNVAMVVGNDGLYQFDISDPNAIEELSVMSVNQ